MQTAEQASGDENFASLPIKTTDETACEGLWTPKAELKGKRLGKVGVHAEAERGKNLGQIP